MRMIAPQTQTEQKRQDGPARCAPPPRTKTPLLPDPSAPANRPTIEAGWHQKGLALGQIQAILSAHGMIFENAGFDRISFTDCVARVCFAGLLPVFCFLIPLRSRPLLRTARKQNPNPPQPALPEGSRPVGHRDPHFLTGIPP